MIPTLEQANAAKRVAQAERASAIAEVVTGRSIPADIILRACQPEHKSLLRIQLVRLFAAQDGVSAASVRRALAKVHELLEQDTPTESELNRLTVMWLLDSRAGGRRVLAFADALDKKTDAPWPGFPYTMPGTGKRTR